MFISFQSVDNAWSLNDRHVLASLAMARLSRFSRRQLRMTWKVSAISRQCFAALRVSETTASAEDKGSAFVEDEGNGINGEEVKETGKVVVAIDIDARSRGLVESRGRECKSAVVCGYVWLRPRRYIYLNADINNCLPQHKHGWIALT